MSSTTTQLDWREGRRRRAWERKEQGWKQQDIAAALGVTPGAVSQWLKRGRAHGVEGGKLRRHPGPGRQPRLSVEQMAQLPAIMEHGPEAYGFRGQIWTCKRVAEVIWRTVGVSYHPAHVSRLLHHVHHSVQRPTERTSQRNATQRRRHPGVVARTLAGPRKKAAAEGRTIVWVDQAGFYLLPLAVRTWAPCGQTPLLQVPLTRDHLAAISGITADGRLFMQTQEPADHSDDLVRFLRVLLRTIHGKLLVIWDGSPIHPGQPVKDFLRNGAARRLHLEQLPGYVPELNPDEGSWNDLKRVELANLCCPDLLALALALRRAKERLRHQRTMIQACIRQAGYHV